ncbi:hypothetical protein HNP52_001926 [Sphingomonas kyeonggiensis]|uniref:Uncharacterized protein n=1 Tax=Sphingomonas kyeonggiensis TaxID=1268553 RepID=A0A7W7K194_9SPHN|nr:hypothetical protein [Sphingomonas kyeonggiensis]MBB4838857.1 hypothetical protein [Sphingomonas kyeonggiensis]
MSRRVARIAFIITLVAMGIVLGIVIGLPLLGWGGGMGAVLGTAALLTAGTMFDRLFPCAGAAK